MKPLTWRPGLSVLMLHRDSPMREGVSRRVRTAAEETGEPFEIVKIDAGAKGVRSAILEGLARSHYDAVYLLDSQRTPMRGAFREILRWRAPHVSAMSSAISSFDGIPIPAGLTGWIDAHFEGGVYKLTHLKASALHMARGTACASTAASMFHRSCLGDSMSMVGDVEDRNALDLRLSENLWRNQGEVLFVPGSQVALGRKEDSDPTRIVRESNEDWVPAPELLKHRCAKLYPTPFEELLKNPTLIVVSPYKILPPEDEGAQSICRMLRAAQNRFRVVLLSDERKRYDATSGEAFSGFAAVHLVDGRQEPENEVGKRIPRIRNHSHEALGRELSRLISCYRPVLVQLEHIELALLVAQGKQKIPWIIDLHRPVTTAEDPCQNEDDREEIRLLRPFDEVIDWEHPPEDLSTQVSIIEQGGAKRALLDRLGTIQLHLLVAMADCFGPLLRRFLPIGAAPALQWKAGLTVLIPERGCVDLLEPTLDSLAAAIRAVSEPVQVVIIVNGALQAAYEGLATLHKGFEWIYESEALGFGGAIYRGLQETEHDWVYLLNSDMALDPMALSEILRWRGTHVSAIASQVVMADKQERRVDTGWTAASIRNGWLEPRDEEPEDPIRTRGALYAGGGASLHHTAHLKRLLRSFDPYHPFYCEDVEWGLRSWRMGYTVLFAPMSLATHQWRATIRRFYEPAEVVRIWRRNLLQLQLRNFRSVCAGTIQRLDPKSRRELTRTRRRYSLFRARLSTYLAPLPNIALDRAHLGDYECPP